MGGLDRIGGGEVGGIGELILNEEIDLGHPNNIFTGLHCVFKVKMYTPKAVSRNIYLNRPVIH